MTRKMTKEQYHQFKMNKFVRQNASIDYDPETETVTAYAYFNNEDVERALKKGYGFQGE